jgi:hypothetical protein
MNLTSKSESTETVYPPEWSRTTAMKARSRGMDNASVLFEAHPEEKGQDFLKCKTERVFLTEII